MCVHVARGVSCTGGSESCVPGIRGGCVGEVGGRAFAGLFEDWD